MTTRWLSFPKHNPHARVRLFCFPYAGSGSNVFRSWPDYLPGFVEVCSVQLPGRGLRLSEPLFTRLQPLVETMASLMIEHLDKPFAFFGHSMGALISFELARQLRRSYGLKLVYLFVSGRAAPQISGPELRTYDLPETEFVAELHRLNGTPRELLEHNEMVELMLPVIRADFAVCQTYQYPAEPPLNCPLTVFGGTQDHEVRREDLEAWRSQTTALFSLHMLPGDHFFLHESQGLLLSTISEEMNQLVQTP